jgi:hypothetical protein
LEWLSIVDIDVVQIRGEDHILLTDANSKLIAFKFTEFGKIEDPFVIDAEGTLRNFAVSAWGTWLIANTKYVIEAALRP